MTFKSAPLLIALATIPAPSLAAATSAVAAMTCSNTVSGASWTIRIDYDRSTVDSNPARIAKSEISWHDPNDGGHYTLDLDSGRLTQIVASSTGGFILNHHCVPETPAQHEGH
jgi:hypothetical protein